MMLYVIMAPLYGPLLEIMKEIKVEVLGTLYIIYMKCQSGTKMDH